MKKAARPLSLLFLPIFLACGSDGQDSVSSNGGSSADEVIDSGENSSTGGQGSDPTGKDEDLGEKLDPAAGGSAESAGGSSGASGGSASGGRGSQGSGGSESRGGSGGSAGGSTVCGTAQEGDVVTLSCPNGEVIESVLFASYGTLASDCESLTAGECHSDTSESFVSSRCIGRATCNLSASNASFGDPCSGQPKNLVVEVACEEGEPTVEPGENGPYKGVANSPANELAALGSTWCYNWMKSPQQSDCDDPLFVPMIWGSGDLPGAISDLADAGYTVVLGFNEPNKSDQANMSVAEAIELWPALTSDPGIRVGSPAVSDDGRAWLEEFMSEVQDKGLRVDFIAMHWYGWNEGSCTANQFEGAVNWASQWGLPVWITEFGCMGSSNADEKTLLDFFDASIPMLAAHPLVERYAWYPWNTYNHLYLADENENRVMTALGESFAAAPPYP